MMTITNFFIDPLLITALSIGLIGSVVLIRFIHADKGIPWNMERKQEEEVK